jgi:ATP-dependent helicase HrpB
MTSGFLPVDTILADVLASLEAGRNVVIEAPPGAGKSTRVPLALLQSPSLGEGRILLLEPRRLAARSLSRFLASSMGEKVGQSVGLMVRFEAQMSAQTRLVVMTEGVFLRRLVDDPELVGVSAIIFDEVHERSVETDVGLALAREIRSALRPDLRLVAMSATLDAEQFRSYLDADLHRSEGRTYPIETIHVSRDPHVRMEDHVVRVTLRALKEQSGSVLVFLPGVGEIRRVQERLVLSGLSHSITVYALYGSMDARAQDEALVPAPPGSRKIVLATSLAETSLTIEGVDIVIDSGLSRRSRFEPQLGLSRLETVKAARNSIDQRRGRAGRVKPGVCYRLWDEASELALVRQDPPALFDADLSGVVLDLAAFGICDPEGLAWLDKPPSALWKVAKSDLFSLQALDEKGSLTNLGKQMRALGLPARLAAMVIRGHALGCFETAAELAMLISERGLGGESIDLLDRLERWRSERSGRAQAARSSIQVWLKNLVKSGESQQSQELSEAQLLLFAYPDRVAQKRGDGSGSYVMANGRAVMLDAYNPLFSNDYIVIADLTGDAKGARVLSALGVSWAEIEQVLGAQIERAETLEMTEEGALRGRMNVRLGAIVERSVPMAKIRPGRAARMALGRGLDGRFMARGWGLFDRSERAEQLVARLMLMRQLGDPAQGENGWPDLSGDKVIELLKASSRLDEITSLREMREEDLIEALLAPLPYDLRRRLELEMPETFQTPVGTRVCIDYKAEGGPKVEVRVQQVYGLSEHPKIGRGRVPLSLSLLSPAQRPIQITKDLPAFWKGSWADVRKSMRADYPKHDWPEDPSMSEARVHSLKRKPK